MVQKISGTFHFAWQRLFPLNSNCPFFPPSSLTTDSTFCFCKFDYFRHFIYVVSCGICPSSLSIMSSLSNKIHPCCNLRRDFCFKANIPLSIYTIFALFFHLTWMVRLLLPFGYCDECCSEQGSGASISTQFWFQVFWINIQKWDFWFIL